MVWKTVGRPIIRLAILTVWKKEYPVDRLAISGNAILNRFQTSLIRNAAAIAAFVADDRGKSA